MDHYITEFYKNKDNCKVIDYAVYMEKKTGLARFNPFAVIGQAVVYLTDRGCYFCRIKNMGEFTMPVSLERAAMALDPDGKLLRSIDDGDLYAYARKWKDGANDSCEEFAAAVRAHTR